MQIQQIEGLLSSVRALGAEEIGLVSGGDSAYGPAGPNPTTGTGTTEYSGGAGASSTIGYS